MLKGKQGRSTQPPPRPNPPRPHPPPPDPAQPCPAGARAHIPRLAYEGPHAGHPQGPAPLPGRRHAGATPGEPRVAGPRVEHRPESRLHDQQRHPPHPAASGCTPTWGSRGGTEPAKRDMTTPPARHTANDAAETYARSLQVPIPMQALGWASAQGPTSTASHATLRPPGGPPPEEVDGVSEGRHHVLMAGRRRRRVP